MRMRVRVKNKSFCRTRIIFYYARVVRVVSAEPPPRARFKNNVILWVPGDVKKREIETEKNGDRRPNTAVNDEHDTFVAIK